MVYLHIRRVITIKFEPVIKWSGSKRSQSENIIKNIPSSEYDTYYEPFCGGASVMFQLINSDIKFNKYICSDKNSDLINLWNLIKDNPESIYTHYKELWLELSKDDNISRKRDFFNEIRNRLNLYRDPKDFMFIMRTTTNGLPRYNNSGEFNNSYHLSRNGINPESLLKILDVWSSKLNDKDVIFMNQNYNEIKPSKNDLVYLDPPYANTKGMYFGGINQNTLLEWIDNLCCTVLMSYNGKTIKSDNTQDIKIFDKHIYLESGNSSYSRLFSGESNNKVSESLYFKFKLE